MSEREWKPIETAPRNRQLLLFVKYRSGTARTTGYWSASEGRWVPSMGTTPIEPVYWAELPAIPVIPSHPAG